MTDDDIRAALTRYADATPHLDPRAGLAGRVARRERARRAAAGTAASLLLVGGAGVAALVRDDDRAGIVPAEQPSPGPAVATAAGDFGLRVRVALAGGGRSVPAGTEAEIVVEATDDDGAIAINSVGWGDGAPVGGVVGGPGCAPPTGPPDPGPEPGARRETYRHAWRQPGTYTVTVSVSTQQTCDPSPPPEESAVARLDVVVTDAPTGANGPGQIEARSKPTVWVPEDAEPYERRAEASFADLDGYVTEAVVDWGDGSRPTRVRNPEPCDDGGGRYFPENSILGVHEDHTFAPGEYVVRFTVTSAGCDGSGEQTAAYEVPVRVR